MADNHGGRSAPAPEANEETGAIIDRVRRPGDDSTTCARHARWRVSRRAIAAITVARRPATRRPKSRGTGAGDADRWSTTSRHGAS